MKLILFNLLFVLGILTSAPAAEGENFSTLKREADRLFDTGHYKEARETYLKAKALNDKDPTLYLRLGQIEMATANITEAIQQLENLH